MLNNFVSYMKGNVFPFGNGPCKVNTFSKPLVRFRAKSPLISGHLYMRKLFLTAKRKKGREREKEVQSCQM